MTVAGDLTRAKILAALDEFARDNGYSPTVREVAERVGLSKSAAFKHLSRLRDEGLVHTPRPGAGWYRA